MLDSLPYVRDQHRRKSLSSNIVISLQEDVFHMHEALVDWSVNRLFSLRSGRSTAATTESTTESRCEFTRSTAFLALTTIITTTISTLAVATITTVASITTWAATTSSTALTTVVTTHHTTRRSMAALLFDMRSWHDLSGQVKPFAQVVEALGGESVVVVLPGELGLEVAAGGEGLASLDDVEVLGVDVAVLGEVEVLLGHEHTLSEEVLVDLLAIGLGNEHFGEIF